MKKENILVIGANGQIGTVLTETLRAHFGDTRVLATDLHAPEQASGWFETLDVLDGERLNDLVAKHQIQDIYHLAAILSAKGEQNPKWAWDINMQGLFQVLEVAKMHHCRIFFPSSIAVFGGESPKYKTPQHAVLQPQTVYGISKVAGEHWCNYYHQKYQLDTRSVRYPGIIGYQSLPGGGTTDYAVDIYHKAVQGLPFECFLKADTTLPMMYMNDAIRATIELMQAPAEQVKIRTSYNIASMSFTPSEIADSIRKQIPDFQISYQPDFRQAIAESWPASIDDSAARNDWHWHPAYDLDQMTQEMLWHLQEYYQHAGC
ncbi:MAG TPA: NAD-dependent epimerase/dehydratase family protein [Saprospiraceae bacterium]|nr:NAD-dependent epimerase/dehydratase family protein [Saprospiraceae bacterium]HMP23142.1 NAD-dependent epimerase/dehydratase family protein [Saprospiraceae bacterium]